MITNYSPAPVAHPLQVPQPLRRVLLRLPRNRRRIGGPTSAPADCAVRCGSGGAPIALASPAGAIVLLGGGRLVVEARLDDAVFPDHRRRLE